MPFLKRTLLTASLVILTLYILQPQNRTMLTQFYYYIHPTESIQCYRTKTTTLPDISDSKPSPGRSIFFHETSCNSHFTGKIYISARQACAVESAARLNPNSEIYLLFASPGIFRFEGSQSDRLLQALLTHANVRVRHVDYERYTRGTPVEELYRRGRVEVSRYAQSHASDVLRYLTLWKYGGTYLDLDVIVTKSLELLPPNYAGAESVRHVAAGVLNFSPEGRGHKLAERCLKDLSDNFRGYDWGYNGPGVITRLLKEICQGGDCQGFRIFPKEAFYPVSWWDWRMYFEEEWGEKVLNVTRGSYVVHVWNKHSGGRKVRVGGRSAYAILARRFCPKVVQECGEWF